MGWSRGSDLMRRIIKVVNSPKLRLQYHTRRELYRGIIDALEDHDWDTQDECTNIDDAFDDALHLLHPDES